MTFMQHLMICFVLAAIALIGRESPRALAGPGLGTVL
jgi:hypothetical protein